MPETKFTPAFIKAELAMCKRQSPTTINRTNYPLALAEIDRKDDEIKRLMAVLDIAKEWVSEAEPGCHLPKHWKRWDSAMGIVNLALSPAPESEDSQ